MHLDHAHHGPAAVSADAARPDGTRRALRIGLGVAVVAFESTRATAIDQFTDNTRRARFAAVDVDDLDAGGQRPQRTERSVRSAADRHATLG